MRRKKNYILCKKCGVEIGEYKLDHIDEKLKEWGLGGGKVYKPYYYENCSTFETCKDCDDWRK